MEPQKIYQLKDRVKIQDRGTGAIVARSFSGPMRYDVLLHKAIQIGDLKIENLYGVTAEWLSHE